MSFLAPSRLWLLLLVPLAAAGYREASRRRTERRGALAAEGLVLVGADRTNHKRTLAVALFLASLVTLAVAAARPQISFGLPRREGTVVLAFDVSGSMAATDLEPTRMQAAQAAATAFVEDQPGSIRIGVVAFGEGGFLAQPPTDDRSAVLDAIARLDVQGGTALGEGIFSALSAIAGEPLVLDPEELGSDTAEVEIGYYPSAAIVVLSDGENTAGADPVEMASVASVAGVDIHTVGLGRPEGTTLEIDGFTVATKLDEALLQAVAETANGTYRAAATTEALSEVYDSIDLEWVTRDELREVTAFAAGAGLLSLVLGAGLSLWWFGRITP